MLYRVFPHVPSAGVDQPGHPTYVHHDQGSGRWDNPDLYRALYVATTAEGAIGEAFAHLSRWRSSMLDFPSVAGSRRDLVTYELDEESEPILDLDDPRSLLDRAIRPSEVVFRNRPHTQQIARDVFGEGKWSGLGWWSMHRPQWALRVLFGAGAVQMAEVESLSGHAALVAAGSRLAKVMDPDLLG